MRIISSDIEGVYTVELEPIQDERGYFARSFCHDEFADIGLDLTFVQANTALSRRARTVRGIHHQLEPHAEHKYVRCTVGAVYDVAVDLRPNSSTYLCWTGVRLTADNHTALLVPPGCGHGYMTLVDDTELEYWTTHRYAPEAMVGVRFDDPAIAIVGLVIQIRGTGIKISVPPGFDLCWSTKVETNNGLLRQVIPGDKPGAFVVFVGCDQTRNLVFG